ncbi:major facilitator superfamily transporter multidrug resistance [Grosmannia clavigera kw1407]|uniref:Major facilitator superfamily transporter multidrug resistance n=1 Tax=Grosmannia clavigera (strain kw1407 / UAMH 11150) TaxID=655863 RepID=F0XQY0_GROCL|nr:major facilitator superfamily transporter multidrug resistance [Grosmannia clavigera kw1407]EFW99827.1 major facilitator superfamily transporter multidrug resistance [Grosmannia clavigera kw1407]
MTTTAAMKRRLQIRSLSVHRTLTMVRCLYSLFEFLSIHLQPVASPFHTDSFRKVISRIDDHDAETRCREEMTDNMAGQPIHGRSCDRPTRHDSSGRSSSETLPNDSDDASDPDNLIVSWEDNDRENPYNWSTGKKLSTLTISLLIVINSNLGTSLPSNAVSYIVAEWPISSTIQKVLPNSMYLVGYVFGPLVWAPLSEQVGRRLIMVFTFFVFIVFTMACALAPNWPVFLVFRLICGVSASSPVVLVAGVMADMYGDPKTRGRAVAVFLGTTLIGSLTGPIVSGFCAPAIGWRWSFWVALIFAGVCAGPLLLMPETYGPVLLAQRAKKMRREDGFDDSSASAPKRPGRPVAPHEIDLAGQSWRELASVVLTRPLRMMLGELIVSCVCAYVALVYAIFYMTFQAFPLIFEGIYGFSPGVCGLIFLPIGSGALLMVPIFLAYDHYLQVAVTRGEAWTQREEYRRLPLACLGGPLFVVSLFWLGWSSRSDVSFVVPMLAGIPFGMGFLLIFMALTNYITDAYEIFAASANAATSTTRSLLATVLPLATTPLFTRLTISGACSLLGGLSLLMCAIPFLFIWKGERIRAGSHFCNVLRERKADMERKVEEQRHRQPALQGPLMKMEKVASATERITMSV